MAMVVGTMKPFKRKTASTITTPGVRQCMSHRHAVLFTLILFILLPSAFTQTFASPPTSFTSKPVGGSTEVQNNTKVLLCGANGLPSPVYRWYKDGRFLTSNSSVGSLRIPKVQLADAGRYQCVASNVHGALISAPAIVHVAYLVRFNQVTSKVVEVNKGDAAVLQFPPLDGYPAPNIYWYEGSERLGPAEKVRRHISLKKELVILEASAADAHQFSVGASNPYGTAGILTNYDFTLKVNAGSSVTDAEIPPVIVIPPSPTTAVQDSDSKAVLECVANARPVTYLTLKWYRVTSDTEKVDIEPGDKYILSMYRRKLTIRNPRTSDTGTYLCEATFKKPDNSFSYPPATASANLTVYVKPKFVSKLPVDMSPDYGSTATIPCNAVGIPNLTYKWYRNAVEIDMAPGSRYQLEETGSLRIEGIKPDDAGVFQCFASNAAGEINSATRLQVLSSPPVIEKRPHNLSVIAGQSARFVCKVTGAPQPVVTWYKATGAGEVEPLVSSSRLEVLESELLIAMTQISDAGNYTCNVSNTIGVATASAYLTVTMRTTITMPPSDASVMKGSTKTLQCQVSHDASVSVTWLWFHNNQTINVTDRRRQTMKDGSLRITSVRNRDVGVYRCQVTSVGGNDSASAAIEIIELPHRPSVTSVKLSTDSRRAVDVAWQPGYDGKSPIRRFIVQYRLLPPGVTLRPDEGWTTASDTVSKDARLYTVTGLRPSQMYQFQVSAVNDVGQGSASAASAVVTLPQQPPSGPPLELVASPRLDSASSVIIQWKPPLEDDWNGALLGYMIRYKLSGYPDNTLSYVNITNYLVTSYRLNDLIIFQEYEVSVAAYNAKGVGVYSNYVTVRTQEGKPEASPTDLTLTPVNSTAFKVTWMPPDPGFINGINQGYKIEAVRPGVDGSKVSLVVPSNLENMLGLQTAYLVDLAKYTNYSVTVLCFTSRGDGPKTDAVESRTLEDVPEQVASLRFEDVLDKTFIALWTPPVRTNGILHGYKLSYMKKGLLITKVTEDLSGLNYTVTGLTATTTYTVEIVALTGVGAGPALVKDVVTGVPPVVPDPPYRLGITNTQSTSVLLQFTPGADGHARIIRWVIEAQKNQNGQWTELTDTTQTDITSLSVSALVPYTNYQLRMIAENIAGRSEPSDPTRLFQTMQAPPAGPPSDVAVRAVNETALHVGWTPLLKERWYGEVRGYRLQHRPHNGSPQWQTAQVRDEDANSFTLTTLQEWTRYDVRVAAYNKVGISSYSEIATHRTRDSVPSAGPGNVTALALSSTTIKVNWDEVPLSDRNGEIKGYKVVYQSAEAKLEAVEKLVNSSTARMTMLTGLRKYVRYQIQMLAYTRIGDGVLSAPPLVIRTDEDVPGPPSRVSFPEVTHSTARIIWSPPAQPNGLITKYRVSYRQKSAPPSYAIVDDKLGPERREFEVHGLGRMIYYVFSVTARTHLGWGEAATAEVYTIVNRRPPDPPTRPMLSEIGDRWVKVTWQPRGDGYGPIRNFTIQVQKEEGLFVSLPDYIPPASRSFTVSDLKPNTKYRFQIAASNDIGTSAFSSHSDQITTKQAAPDKPPMNVQVTPKTRTSVLVTWEPPVETSWNGKLMGYNVEYRVSSQSDWRKTLFDPVVQSLLVDDLELFHTYEFRIRAFNMFGHSGWSTVSVVYLEIAPTGMPQNAAVGTINSTEISISWLPPTADLQNGDLLGYKVYYWLVGKRETATAMRRVPASDTQVTLRQLHMYTRYQVTLLAFNAAGDGPNITVPLEARTSEGVPGQPGELQFAALSMTSLNVSWAAPTEPNGIIENYTVSYYEARAKDGISRSVQVTISGDHRSLLVTKLVENVKYVFSVRARTKIDWGEAVNGSTTTGPQKGSPGSPGRPVCQLQTITLLVSWTSGMPGDSPIQGYLIQARSKKDETWSTVVRKNTSEPTAVVELTGLKVDAQYQFRVVAINSKGISQPSPVSDYFMVPDLSKKPFYQEFWFLIIVALLGLIIIIIVMSLLCLTGKLRRSKYTAARIEAALSNGRDNNIPSTAIHLTENGVRGNLGDDDGGFSTFQVRQSQRSHRRSHRGPPRSDALPPYIRSPPRPSPSSVIYSDEELKASAAGGDDDSSSLTEKPSESGSSTTDSQESDSDLDSEKDIPPPAFSNHYVNGDVQQSWRRNRAAPYNAAYSYPDSEADSSQYGMMLNGGHVLMNNMAGSRTPLPGFSSFV